MGVINVGYNGVTQRLWRRGARWMRRVRLEAPRMAQERRSRGGWYNDPPPTLKGHHGLPSASESICAQAVTPVITGAYNAWGCWECGYRWGHSAACPLADHPPSPSPDDSRHERSECDNRESGGGGR